MEGVLGGVLLEERITLFPASISEKNFGPKA